jgi:hypothetical protein
MNQEPKHPITGEECRPYDYTGHCRHMDISICPHCGKPVHDCFAPVEPAAKEALTHDQFDKNELRDNVTFIPAAKETWYLDLDVLISRFHLTLGQDSTLKKFISSLLASQRQEAYEEMDNKWQMKFAYKLNELIKLLEPVAPAYSIRLTNITADMYDCFSAYQSKLKSMTHEKE